MNLSPDYSAAFCIITTDSECTGHGMTFTIGRGNELVCGAIDLLAPLVVGQSLDELTADWGKTWRYLTSDSQLRWIGPDKGVIHLALGALVNALWDLWAKTLGRPVWQVVADMTPEEVVKCLDFRYITDALTPEEAVALLKEARAGREDRIADALCNEAVPAYTTSAGWLGYGEDKMRSLLKQTVDEGYRYFKLKVGTDLEEDRKRLTIAREVLGYDKGNTLMVDANQVRFLLSYTLLCLLLTSRSGLSLRLSRTCRPSPSSSRGSSRSPRRPTTFSATPPSARVWRTRPTVPLLSLPAKCARTALCSSNCCRPMRSTYSRLMPAVSEASTKC